MSGQSPLTRKLITEGLQPSPAPVETFDHLADARRETSCIGLDIRDAEAARGKKRLEHIRDARGRAHQLIHMLNAAEAEARGRAA